MRTLSFVVLATIAGVLAFGAVGCNGKYDALMMQNRSMKAQLLDKDIEIAQLRERVDALSGMLKDLQDKNSALQKSFDDLMKTHQDLLATLAGGGVGEGAIPAQVAADIEKIAAAYPDLFTFDRAKGELRFNADVTFDLGSFVVKPAAAQALGELAKVLTSDVAAAIRVRIIGHTDNIPVRRPETIQSLKNAGVTADNMGLSLARARSVATILQENGVAQGRITTTGMGEEQPVADNKTNEGRAKNRRVEVYLSMPAAGSAVEK